MELFEDVTILWDGQAFYGYLEEVMQRTLVSEAQQVDPRYRPVGGLTYRVPSDEDLQNVPDHVRARARKLRHTMAEMRNHGITKEGQLVIASQWMSR